MPEFKIPTLTSIPGFSCSSSLLILFLLALAVWQYIYWCRYLLKDGEFAIIKRLGEYKVVITPTIWLIPFIDEINFMQYSPIVERYKLKDIVNSEGVRFDIEVETITELDIKSKQFSLDYFKSQKDLHSVIEELLKAALSMAMLNENGRVNTLIFSIEGVENSCLDLIVEELQTRFIILRELKITSIEDRENILKNFNRAMARG